MAPVSVAAAVAPRLRASPIERVYSYFTVKSGCVRAFLPADAEMRLPSPAWTSPPTTLSAFSCFRRPQQGETAEDRELKERLELAVERLKDSNSEIVRAALEVLRKDIRESTR
jgi:hypothetical protein